MEEIAKRGRGLTLSWNGQLDSLRDQFEECWRRGNRLSVVQFLDEPEAARMFAEASAPDQAAILRELVVLEWECRRQGNEACLFDACLARFPDHAAMLSDVIRELSPDVWSGSIAGLSAKELGKRIVDSGLLSLDELKQFYASLTDDVRRGGTLKLIEAFVSSGKLTPYQLEQLAAAKPQPLVLGNYVILRRLGSGGMGDVYQARHSRMKRIVALKVLSQKVVENPTSLDRFQREVEAAARLSHPNIVTAHDADEADGVHFLVMEFVPGVDLSAYVRAHGPLTPAQALDLILQAGRGLAYAHQAGIVHRDIKPANLLLAHDGTLKILDMGLARIDGQESGQDLTSTGQVIGTVPYMSPEQAVNTKTADQRTDIYSLGCTLYYLLAGKPPYRGQSAMETLIAHREQPIPRLAGIHPDVTPALESVYQRMLAKSVQDRYQTMAAALEDLETCGVTPKVGVASDVKAQTTVGAGQSSTETQSLAQSRDATGPSAAPAVVTVTPQSALAAPGSTNRQRLLAGAAAAVLAAALVLAAVIMLRVETPEGVLELTVDQPGAEVFVDGQKRVTIKQAGETTPITIQAVGKKKLELKVTKDGFEAFVQELRLEKDGKQTVHAKLVKRAAAAPQPVGVPETPQPAAAPATRPVVVAAIAEREVFGGQVVRLHLGARDPNKSPAELRYALSDAAKGGELNAKTGEFVWTAPRVNTRQQFTWQATVTTLNPQTPAASCRWTVTVLPEPAAVPGAPKSLPASFDGPAAIAAQQAWATHLKCQVEETNGVGMKLVLIPPGEFLIGSPESDAEAGADERPQHSVRLTQGYLLGKYEVTQGEYESLVGGNPSHFSAQGQGSAIVGEQDTSRFPVEQVTWLDAVTFCNKLSEKEKLPAWYKIDGNRVTVAGGVGYRLPTEAEWEYACRAGTTKYWNADNATELGEVAWFQGNSEERPHPVGEKLANAFGLHDLHGNVWEWCGDWYANYGPGAVVDPQGVPEGSLRVYRGGGWSNTAGVCRTSGRFGLAPDLRGYYLGFRILRVPSGK